MKGLKKKIPKKEKKCRQKEKMFLHNFLFCSLSHCKYFLSDVFFLNCKEREVLIRKGPAA